MKKSAMILRLVLLFAALTAIVTMFGRRWLADGMPAGDFPGTVAYLYQFKQVLSEYGYVPLWCGRWFAGGSLVLPFALGGSLFCYLPFTLFLPVTLAVKVGSFFYFAISGLTMYILIRYLFGSRPAAFFAALTYSIHPIHISIAVSTGHANFPPFYALAPLGFLFAFRLIDRCRWQDFAGLSVVAAGQIWIDTERAFVTLLFVFLASQILMVLERRSQKNIDVEIKARQFWQKQLFLVASLIVAALLCSWALLPATIEKGDHALFAEELRISSAKYFSLQNPFYLFDRNGCIVSQMAKYLPPELHYNSGNYYLSISLFALAGLGVLSVSRKTIQYRYCVILIICVISALLCSNGYYSTYEGLCNVVGKLMTNSYYRHYHPFQLPTLALLLIIAPAALSSILYLRRHKKGKPASIRAWILGGAIFAAVFFTKPFEWIFVFIPFYREMRSPSWFASVVPSLGMVVAAAAAVVWLLSKIKQPVFKWLFSLILCGLFIFDVWPYHKVFDQVIALERTEDLKTVSRYLADQPDNSRVLARETYNPLTDSHILYSDKPSAFSYLNWDSPKYYSDLVLNGIYSKLHRPETINSALDEAGIANVGYIIYDLVEGPPPPQTENLELGCETKHYFLYKNKSCRPYVQTYPAQITNSPEINLEMERYSEDIAKVQNFSRRKPGYIEFEIDSAKPATVMISESWYPGWKAKVNGKREDVIRLQKAFMAVKVPAGKHVISFWYQKPFYHTIGYTLSVVTLIFMVLLSNSNIRNKLKEYFLFFDLRKTVATG